MREELVSLNSSSASITNTIQMKVSSWTKSLFSANYNHFKVTVINSYTQTVFVHEIHF